MSIESLNIFTWHYIADFYGYACCVYYRFCLQIKKAPTKSKTRKIHTVNIIVGSCILRCSRYNTCQYHRINHLKAETKAPHFSGNGRTAQLSSSSHTPRDTHTNIPASNSQNPTLRIKLADTRGL